MKKENLPKKIAVFPLSNFMFFIGMPLEPPLAGITTKISFIEVIKELVFLYHFVPFCNPDVALYLASNRCVRKFLFFYVDL